MNTNSNTNVTLLVGESIQDVGERRFITRLVEDLKKAQVEAVLFANFITPGRNQRQVDLLVWTPKRVLQVEIKSLDQTLPGVAHVNGDWAQRLPNGTERSLGKNCYRQALNATFAVSDRLARLMPRSDGRKPWKDIDTVVCIYPDVPSDSQLEPADHVTVLGYPALLARILTAARNQPFTPDIRESLARDLHVYDDSDPEDTYIARTELLDYGHRAAQTWSTDLAELVPLDLTLGRGSTSVDDLERRLRAGLGVLLTAPSGWGKTFLSRHLAARISDQGDLVIWLHADEYVLGRLSALLSRAAAPFSSAKAMDLVRTASTVGSGIVLVVDALNACPATAQADLLDQLSAFRLRYPAGVLLTSTAPHQLPAALDAEPAQLHPPTVEQRSAILSAHGSPHAAVSPAFTTPHELALVAQCSSALASDASVTDLHDAYIRAVAPTESVRAGLRAVAAWLHSHHHTSAARLTVAGHLGSRSGLALSPELVDDVLTNPMLDPGAGPVRFRHDLLRDFLAAEAIVRDAETTGDLAARLDEPVNRSLVHTALELEADDGRVIAVLDAFADRELFVAALAGGFGSAVRARVHDAATLLLHEAAAATVPGCALVHDMGWFGRWEMNRKWAPSTVALLAAAGFVLDDDHLDAIAAVLDATDRLLLAEIARGSEISSLIGSTYAMQDNYGPSSLPVMFLIGGAERRHFAQRLGSATPGRACQHLLLDQKAGWGRCYMAAQAFDSKTDGDLLPALIQRSLDNGGYHLELQVLSAVRHNAGAFSDKQKQAVLAALEDYDPAHWALSSTMVEVLAAFGQIEPLSTFEDVTESLRAILANPSDPSAPRAAASAWARQFEDERILGPYYEAIESLSQHDRIRLLLLAGEHDLVWMDGTRLEELAKASPTGDPTLDATLVNHFKARARHPTAGPGIAHDAVEAFVASLSGLARLGEAPPAPAGEVSDDERAWHLIGRILHRLESGHADAHDDWSDLMTTTPAATADVLYALERIGLNASFVGWTSVHECLVATYPAEMRRILHWSLDHSELTSLWGDVWRRDLDSYVVRTLGRVGDDMTVAKLTPLAADDRVGGGAVDALRRLNERLAAERGAG